MLFETALSEGWLCALSETALSQTELFGVALSEGGQCTLSETALSKTER